ncbi:hypothetical protein HDV06_001099 [Boothiomyces sp. JEL0866]|nr:hypothetical protein HDV06_001099 [Boothiomyces sp. JEL0866]
MVELDHLLKRLQKSILDFRLPPEINATLPRFQRLNTAEGDKAFDEILNFVAEPCRVLEEILFKSLLGDPTLNRKSYLHQASDYSENILFTISAQSMARPEHLYVWLKVEYGSFCVDLHTTGCNTIAIPNLLKYNRINVIGALAYTFLNAFWALDYTKEQCRCLVTSHNCRNLIVDVVESSQQKNGNAMAGIMLGIGNCVGYFVGYLDLTRFGGTQLQNLCWIAILVFNFTVGMTCYYTDEQQQEVAVKTENPIVSIYKNVKNLPKNIAQVCNVQFFSWMGWFPFLFYSASWAGSGDERKGSFALFIFSIVSLVAGFVLPAIQLNIKANLKLVWAFGLMLFFAISFSTLGSNHSQLAVGLMGISWAISIWIPFTLLGEYLNEQDYLPIDDQQQQLSAGVIMGIHNIYVCIPQIFSTLLNMVIFSVIKQDPFGWSIRIGSLFSLFAGFLALKSKFPCKQQ